MSPSTCLEGHVEGKGLTRASLVSGATWVWHVLFVSDTECCGRSRTAGVCSYLNYHPNNEKPPHISGLRMGERSTRGLIGLRLRKVTYLPTKHPTEDQNVDKAWVSGWVEGRMGGGEKACGKGAD